MASVRVYGPGPGASSTAMLGFLSIADGKDVVQESFILFARRARRDGLRCLGNRKIGDMDDSELEQWIPQCCAIWSVLSCAMSLVLPQEEIEPPRR